MSGGDLDNRLKLLFDALRIPKDASELDNSQPEQGSDGILYCLLEDDRLITRLTIGSKRMLAPDSAEVNYVDLDIDVSLTAVTAMVGNIPMLFP